MKRGLLASVLLTSLVCIGTFAGVVLGGWTPKRGLDLAGGLSVVYEPAPGQHVTSATLQTVVNVMTLRVNALGVSQPNIETQGGDVVVQLPGIKNARQALTVIGNTAQLYFRAVICSAPDYVPPKAVKGHKAAAPLFIPSDIVSKVPSTNLFTAAYYSSANNGEYTGPPAGAWATLSQYQTTPVDDDKPDVPVLLADPNNEYGARLLLGPALASGTIISSASAQLTSLQEWVVQASLTGSGTSTFNTIATAHYEEPLANDLGGNLLDAPILESKNYDTGLQISGGNGGFTQSEAGNLALQLNYGAIPIRLKALDTQIVSPTLGAASLRAGLLAGLLGLVLVMGYMILYYRALGIVVVVGLATTGAFIYGLIAILGNSGFGLTLDLSGITGLIVSVGITVDSYVVYFERLKDEIRAGRTIRSSVDRGFKSAYRTVLSADAVSFLGALVLWVLSIGAVKGFAFFLGLSTLIDVATAYLFTRPFVILLGRNRVVTEARWLGIARGLSAAPETGA